MRLRRRLDFVGSAALAAVLAVAALASGVAAAEVPYLTGRVVDDANVLGTEMRERIEAQLKAHEQSTTNQVVVLTVPTLGGETVEEYAEKVFRTWGLGQKGKDNGVLVVIATGDRRMRIEVGYGLEGVLPDSLAGSIIRNAMAPRFKTGDYVGGTEAGVQAILGALAGDASAVPADAPAAEPGTPSSGDGLSGMDAPDMPWYTRVLLGAFIFGIIGLFTVLGVLTPRSGWFLYFFLIPFWAMFPIVIFGAKGAFVLLATYLAAFPIAKLIVRRQPWYEKAALDLKTKGHATVGGFTVSSGGASFGGSSGGGGGGFSGGGGSSGGGGASGGW
ncbi:MAG TPA: TPM domain-containing protein [bacterium]